MTDNWLDLAACKSVKDPSIFFPITAKQEAEARKVCKTCIVKDACLTHALERGENDGIYGGLNPTERAGMSERVKLCLAGCGRPVSANFDPHTLYCSESCRRDVKNQKRRRQRQVASA